MAKVTTRQIVNEVDKECFTFYVEWLDSSFKVMLIKAKEKPMMGKMEKKDIDFFSEELGKTNAEYLEETNEAFSGKNTAIQFSITNDCFEWSQKNVWTLGRINLEPVTSIEALSDTVQNVLRFYHDAYTRLDVLEEENKTLKALKERLTTSMDEMVKIKLSMEQDLYKKFLLVLNKKKEKIRELEKMFHEEGAGVQCVFNASTEGSSESDGEIVDTEMKSLQNAIREKSPQASTSKSSMNEDNNSFGEFNSSPECPKLYVSDNESEDDMFD